MKELSNRKMAQTQWYKVSILEVLKADRRVTLGIELRLQVIIDTLSDCILAEQRQYCILGNFMNKKQELKNASEGLTK